MPTQPTRLTGHLGAGLSQGLLQGPVQSGRCRGRRSRSPARCAPRRESRLCRGAAGGLLRPSRPGLLVPEEIAQDLRHGLARQMAVGHVVDLHGRGQRATAQARDPLDREQLLGVGVLALRDSEMAAERLVDRFGPFDVAGGPHADVDDVRPAGRWRNWS